MTIINNQGNSVWGKKPGPDRPSLCEGTNKTVQTGGGFIVLQGEENILTFYILTAVTAG